MSDSYVPQQRYILECHYHIRNEHKIAPISHHDTMQEAMLAGNAFAEKMLVWNVGADPRGDCVADCNPSYYYAVRLRTVEDEAAQDE
jgi:hypothetical protein